MDPRRPRSREQFQVAIICALPLEADFVLSLFDQHWDDNDGGPRMGKARGDTNSYSIGNIAGHNVVLAHPPGIGTIAAGTIAAFCKLSFTSINSALVVGICGGAPVYNDSQIYLGDVIISTGIIQYDFGRRFPDRFEIKDTLHDAHGRPSPEIRCLLSKLATTRQSGRLRNSIYGILCQLHQSSDTSLQYPGISKDILFPADYRHKHYGQSRCATCAACCSKSDPVCPLATVSSCDELRCDTRRQLERPRQMETREESIYPNVHFGIFASGNSVIKSSEERDQLTRHKNAIGFEMESAGVWDIFPCIVIKGVCDYADSHKNKEWQQFAAASAASCSKALLGYWNLERENTHWTSEERPAYGYPELRMEWESSSQQAIPEPPFGANGSRTGMRRLNEYFLPREGIDHEVISTDIHLYLGGDALLRTGQVQSPFTGEPIEGYFLMGFGHLTTAMIDDLKADSAKWAVERFEQNGAQRNLCVDNSAYNELRYPGTRATENSGALELSYESYLKSRAHAKGYSFMNGCIAMRQLE